ncbi:MAG: hypothetical protein ABJI96_03020 [Paracoccaceae bacterium]
MKLSRVGYGHRIEATFPVEVFVSLGGRDIGASGNLYKNFVRVLSDLGDVDVIRVIFPEGYSILLSEKSLFETEPPMAALLSTGQAAKAGVSHEHILDACGDDFDVIFFRLVALKLNGS